MGLNLYIAQGAKVFTKGPIKKKIIHDWPRWWHLDSLSPYLYNQIFMFMGGFRKMICTLCWV